MASMFSDHQRELLLAIASDKQLQLKLGDSWKDITASAALHMIELCSSAMRLKSNDFPMPYFGDMEYQQVFYIPEPATGSMVSTYNWSGLVSDKLMQERGLVYLDREDAIKRAKTMCISK